PTLDPMGIGAPWAMWGRLRLWRLLVVRAIGLLPNTRCGLPGARMPTQQSMLYVVHPLASISSHKLVATTSGQTPERRSARPGVFVDAVVEAGSVEPKPPVIAAGADVHPVHVTLAAAQRLDGPAGAGVGQLVQIAITS